MCRPYEYSKILKEISQKGLQPRQIYGILYIINKEYQAVLLIYISGYDNYLKELFEVEPFRFLSKPLNLEKFYRYFKILYKLEKGRLYIIIPSADGESETIIYERKKEQ